MSNPLANPAKALAVSGRERPGCPKTSREKCCNFCFFFFFLFSFLGTGHYLCRGGREKRGGQGCFKLARGEG